MSSDTAYSSFLDKANQDTGSNPPSTEQKKQYKTKSIDTEVPSVLKGVKAEYTSETDEKFEPVSLKWKAKEVPDADNFAKLINHKSQVHPLTIKEFDPRNEYNNVIDAVRAASSDGNTVTIYRVEHGTTRVEYYIVGVDVKEERVVGMKVLAVES